MYTHRGGPGVSLVKAQAFPVPWPVVCRMGFGYAVVLVTATGRVPRTR